MGDTGKIFAFLICVIVIFSIIAVAAYNYHVQEEDKMTIKHPLFCRVQDLNSTFLNRIVTGEFNQFIIFTAQIESDSSLSLNSGVTTTSIDNFRSQVLARVPDAEFYAWIWSHVSVDPTTPNISTVGARTTLINNIKTFINTTFAGRFDGVLDDMENWQGLNQNDRNAFVTQCATACDSLFKYYPWMYYSYVGNITATRVAVGLYNTVPYTPEATWKTAFEHVFTDADSAGITDVMIIIITSSEAGSASIADQISWLNDEAPETNYTKMKEFGIYWYYGMDSQDWLDWNNYVNTTTNYMITASADAHSTISPSGYVSVTSGEDQTFLFTAQDGYDVLQVKVDDSAVTLADSVPIGLSCYITDTSQLQTIKDSMFEHGMNTIRISSREAFLEAGSNRMFKHEYVDWFLENTNYTIIIEPNHIYPPTEAGAVIFRAHLTEVYDHLKTIAIMYANNPRIIIEPMNEYVSADLWTQAQDIIDLLRDYTDCGLLFNKWDQAWTALVGDDIYYSYHYYFNSWSVAGAMADLQDALDAGIPATNIINTEMGADYNEAAAFSSSEVAEVNSFLSSCTTLGIGNCLWMYQNIANMPTYDSLGLTIPIIDTSYTFENVVANHTIQVYSSIDTYTLTVSAGSNGSISPATCTVNAHTNKTFTITPDSGYEILSVTVDGIPIGIVTSYTFTDIIANHTIVAAFQVSAPTTYTVNVQKTLGVTVTNEGKNIVADGETIILSAAVMAGFTWSKWNSNGTAYATAQTITFTGTVGNTYNLQATATIDTAENKKPSMTDIITALEQQPSIHLFTTGIVTPGMDNFGSEMRALINKEETEGTVSFWEPPGVDNWEPGVWNEFSKMRLLMEKIES